uniref:uncharacterized protein C10orf105 homolog n=1 Tax=Myxine glutinosa TaxID=7769 RepID=UPI00358E7C63
MSNLTSMNLNGGHNESWITSTTSPLQANDPLPIIVAVIGIFLVIASCIVFMALCRPRGLDMVRHSRDPLPHDPTNSSEPQLTIWQRLGSIRYSFSSIHQQQHRSRGKCTDMAVGMHQDTDQEFRMKEQASA